MANPSIGIHNINAVAILPAQTYTSPTGYNSSPKIGGIGSTFCVIAACAHATGVTVSDTINGVASGNTWSIPTPTTGIGTNPEHEANDGVYLYVFICPNGNGGTNHEITVNGAGDTISVVEFFEVVNASTSSPIDAFSTAYNTAYPLVNPVTPSGSGRLIVGAGYSGGATGATVSASGSGYTALDTYNNGTDFNSFGSAYLAGSTSGSQDPLMTDSHAAQGFAVATIAFQGTGGGVVIPLLGQICL